MYARRNALPNYIRVNRAGGLSVLSFIRALELDDRVIFHVAVDEATKQLLLTPTQMAEIPEE